jgi:hypothetical protein
MEQIENPMILPEYEYKKSISDDVWAELEDIAWEDIRNENL